MTAPLEIAGLCVNYGDTAVVQGFDLTVQAGEVVSLLGPSGCGKTTTLRAIAGFIQPDAGTVRLHGEDRTTAPPNRRNIGFVFQGYALFPHMTVFDNVAYGLRTRGVKRAEIAERVRRALALVQLAAFGERRPKQLSGGQQQRVAIARAMVIEPDVLLLDEPLSNLDAKLRQELRVELRRLLKATHIASIFVTHDQEEAITLSDRIVLMHAGRIEQQGTPFEMYHRPASLFAAAFLGQANFLHGVATELAADGTATIEVAGARFRGVACGEVRPGGAAVLVVKHDRVRPAEGGTLPNTASCRFDVSTFLGASVQLQCLFGEQRLTGHLPTGAQAAPPFQPEQPIHLGWEVADALVFPATAP